MSPGSNRKISHLTSVYELIKFYIPDCSKKIFPAIRRIYRYDGLLMSEKMSGNALGRMRKDLMKLPKGIGLPVSSQIESYEFILLFF